MKTPLAIVAAILTFALTSPSTGRAATYTWTGTGFMGTTNHLWSDGFNWQGLAAPSPGEANVTLVFPNSAAPRNTTNDIVGLSVAAIQFQGANYVIAGKPTTNALTLSSGLLGGFSVNVTGTNCQIVNSSPFVLGSAGSITVPAGNTFRLSSRVSGTGGFTKFGAGKLLLNPISANTFTGTVTLYDGTLDLEGGFFFMGSFIPAVTMSGALTIGNTNAALTPLCRVSQPNQIADTTPVTVNDNGQLYLDGVDDTIGALTLVGGIVSSGGGTLTLNGDVAAQMPASGGWAGQIAGHVHLGDLGRTFDVQDTNALLYISAPISGGNIGNAYAGLTKAGPGVLMLAGSNSFPGYTFVSEGVLNVANAMALGSTNRPTSVATNATLDLSGVAAGAIVTGEELDLYGGATLMTDRDAAWHGPIVFNGNSFIAINDSNTVLTVSGILSGGGGFTTTGDGELVMTGPDHNTYTGSTVAAHGTLTLQKGTVASPRASVSGPLIVGSPADTNTLVNLLRTETISSGNLTVVHSGAVLFGPSVTQTVSTLTVTRGEIDTGSTGLLKLAGDVGCAPANAGGEAAAIKGRLDLGDAPRTFFFTYYGSLTVDASITGTSNATLIVNSPGVGSSLRLSGSNSYQGLTVVQDGVLYVDHPHSLGGTNAGTVVSNSASLAVRNSITNESLQLTGKSDIVSYRTLTGSAIWPSTNSTWRGPVTLQNKVEIDVGSLSSTFTIAGPISGPGGLTKMGEGELILAGVDGDNTYAGLTTVLEGGTLTLAKSAGNITRVAIPNDLKTGSDFDIGPAGIVRFLASGQMKSNAVINVNGYNSEVRFEAGTNSVGNISGSGYLEGHLWLGSNALLRTGFLNGNGGYLRSVTGGDPANPTNVCLEKFGFGVFAINKTNQLHAAIDIRQGILVCDTMPVTKFIVRNGGQLGSTGNVGPVHMDGGAFLPGSTNKVTRIPASVPAPGLPNAGYLKLGEYRLEVDAAPNVDNLRLDLIFPAVPEPPLGTQFMIISNRSGNPVLGTLNHPVTGSNLVEGAKFYNENLRYSISYVGGDGNDVVVTRVAAPVAAQVVAMGPDIDGLFMNVTGEPGTEYRVQTATNLATPTVWSDIGTVTPNGAGFANFYDEAPLTEQKRFYRFITP